MQQVGSTPLWSARGVPNPPDIIQTDFTPTETAPTRGTRVFLDRQSSQLNSILNAITLW